MSRATLPRGRSEILNQFFRICSPIIDTSGIAKRPRYLYNIVKYCYHNAGCYRPEQEGISIKKGRFESPRRNAGRQTSDAQKHVQAGQNATKKAAGASSASGQAERAAQNKQPKQPKQTKPSGNLSAAARVAIIAGALVVVAVVALCGYGYALKNRGTIFPNVYVAGINVGGLKRDAAVAAVENAVNKSYASDSLTVVLPDRELTLDPEVTNVALNPDEAIDAAMAYGREGGPIRAIKSYMSAKNAEYTVDLESSLNLDTDYIRQLIDKTAKEVQTAVTESSVSVEENEEGIATRILVTVGSPALSLDADKLYEAVIQRFNDGDFSDLSFEYDATPCAAIDLQQYYDKFCTEVEDAYYDEETHELVEEVTGYGFDLPYYTQQIAMADAGEVITIELEPIEAEVTLEDLSKQYFSDTLAKFDSWHVANASRTNNLVLACKAIDGTILNPDEEFSFNNIVGERTVAKGYLAATVYLDGGRSEAETGGGICQVASTIYEAVLYANLKVTERAPHMFEVTYVDPGQDATIYWGSQDFKFKNSTGYPIRIDTSVSDGYVHVALVGTAEEKDYDHIAITGETVSTTPWKTVGVLDKDAKDSEAFEITFTGENINGTDGKTYKLCKDKEGNVYKSDGSAIVTPYTGKSVKVYRNFLDENNKVLKTETIGTSTYNKRDEKYLVSAYDEETDNADYVAPDYDPRTDPDSPYYDPRLDPDSPYYDPSYDPDDPFGGSGNESGTGGGIGGDSGGIIDPDSPFDPSGSIWN